MSDSNRPPTACKAAALPNELIPQTDGLGLEPRIRESESPVMPDFTNRLERHGQGRSRTYGVRKALPLYRRLSPHYETTCPKRVSVVFNIGNVGVAAVAAGIE